MAKLTDKTIQKILDLRGEGKTYRAIGREVNLSYETVRNVLNMKGIHYQDAVTERNTKMIQMWDEGLSIAEISREFDCSSTATSRVLTQSGAGSDMTRAEKIRRGLGRAVETGRKRKYSKDDELFVVCLYNDGVKVNAIKEKTGMNATMVYRILKRNNIRVNRNGGQ